jgi:chromosome segregation ATPase
VALVVPGEGLHADLPFATHDEHHDALGVPDPAGLQEKWAETSTAIARLKKDLVNAQAEAAKAREELAALRPERDSLASAAKLFESELERASETKLVLEEELGMNRRRLSATEAQLEARERDLADAQASLHGGATEMHAALRANGELMAENARLRRELDGAVQFGRTTEQALEAARSRVSELEPRLAGATSQRDELAEMRTRLEAEIESLRKDLLSSAEGRELVELRKRLERAELERGKAERLRTQAEEEMSRVAASESRQRADVEALLKRCESAERRVEAMAEPQLQKDNEVLRGIVKRQKEQLQQQYNELSSVRRKRVVLRIGYLIFGMCVVGVIWSALQLFPNALQFLHSWGF